MVKIQGLDRELGYLFFFFIEMIIKFQEEHWVLIFREMRLLTNTEDFGMLK